MLHQKFSSPSEVIRANIAPGVTTGGATSTVAGASATSASRASDGTGGCSASAGAGAPSARAHAAAADVTAFGGYRAHATAAADDGGVTLPVNVAPSAIAGNIPRAAAAAVADDSATVPENVAPSVIIAGDNARAAAAVNPSATLPVNHVAPSAIIAGNIARAAAAPATAAFLPVHVARSSSGAGGRTHSHPIIGSPIATVPPALFSPVLNSPPPINNNIEELFEESDAEEYIDAKTELVLRENSLKSLVAMSIGLKDGEGMDLADLTKEPFANYHDLKSLRPNKDALYLEVCRRHNIKKLAKREKIGKSLPKKTYLELLIKNPITQPACIEFLKKKISQLKTGIIEETKERERQISSNRARGSYFTGLLYKIRVIECIFRENAKSALANFFNSLTREELDGRNNPEAARACPWTIGADNYNDEAFDVVSVEFPTLHEEFKDTIKVTYSDVKHMGKMTPDRLKNEFSKMQVEMKVFLSRWARSGNGEGTREDDSDDVLGSDDDDCGLGGCMEEKRNFLGKFGPHILYLEARSNQVGLFQVVAQTMKEGMEMDGNAPSVFTPNKKQKKNSTAIDTVYADLNKEISKTNRALAISNLESKKERRSMLMKSNMDLQVKILVFRERGVSEGMLEVLQEGHDQVANEIKELDAEIKKYEAEMTDEVQVN